MYKKLVPYDQWHFTEIDQVCLKRKAQALKDLIALKVPANDPYQIRSKLVPLLDACLRGEITKPLNDEREMIGGNYSWDKREGTLPAAYDDHFHSVFSSFAFTVKAMAGYTVEKVMKDGAIWAEMEFEEPGDWPDEVLRLEDERRRARMGADYVPAKRY